MKNTQSGFILPLIFIVVAALSIGGGVYYVHRQKTIEKHTPSPEVPASIDISVNASGSTSSLSSPTETPPATVSLSGELSLSELLSLNTGKSVVCDARVEEKGMLFLTKTYMNAGKIRADATTTSNGKVTQSSFLLLGTTGYVWSGEVGYRVTMDQTFDLATLLSSPLFAQGPLGEKHVYTCTPWTLDPSKFVVPTSVSFMEQGSVTLPTVTPDMLKGLMNGTYRPQ